MRRKADKGLIWHRRTDVEISREISKEGQKEERKAETEIARETDRDR